MFRCDLGIAIQNGSEAIFFRDEQTEPLIPYDQKFLRDHIPELPNAHSYWGLNDIDVDVSLRKAWECLSKFCMAINLAADKQRQLPPETLLSNMSSITYRLLRMDQFGKTSVNETLRIGLLAFCSHIFLQWQNLKVPQGFLLEAYQNNFNEPEVLERIPTLFKMWLLLVGSFSIFSPLEDNWAMPFIQDVLKSYKIRTWADLREQFRYFPWVNMLHDDLGQRCFESATTS